MLKELIVKLFTRMGLWDETRRLKNVICVVLNHLIYTPCRGCRYFYSYLRFILRRRSAKKSHNIDRKSISLLCPTRGRYKQAARLVSSVYQTAAFPERVEILFYIDSDDDDKNAYMDFLQKAKKRYSRLKRCSLFLGEPEAFLGSWNVLANGCKGDVLITANDDQVYVDYGWDLRLDEEVDKFPDEIFCMWFNDGIRKEEFCLFPIVSRKWVNALGYFSPDIFGMMIDPWIMNIASRVGRLHYIPDVHVDHLHCSSNMSLLDDTYKRRYAITAELHRKDQDADSLFEKTEPERVAAAEKLKAVVEDYKREDS